MEKFLSRLCIVIRLHKNRKEGKMSNEEQIQKNYALGVNAFAPEQGTVNSSPAVLDDDGGYFGKPDFYDYSDFQLPDNYGYDETLLGEFNDLAAKYNLSQKGANELMSMAVRLSQLTGDNYSKTLAEQQRLQAETYRKALLTDREIGGSKLNKSMAAANVAYSHFVDPQTQIILQQAGLNCHPGIVKMFCKIGKQMQNDAVLGANIPAPHQETREEILFPTMF